jgi:hypothetical protein
MKHRNSLKSKAVEFDSIAAHIQRGKTCEVKSHYSIIIARIGGSVPQEVLIDMAALHEIAPCSAHRMVTSYHQREF